MEFANQLILFGAFLFLLSIFAGLVSSRIGAPLLLVFLGLGMFFGEDGPGRIYFDNYYAAYLIGSIALAIILFDGGLRTKVASFRLAAWPALLLATVGVVVTAALTGVAAHWLLGLGWIESFLIGAIVGSTDAAAVFFLLHLHGLDLNKRVSSTLEVESGLNDPMAIFLTVTCVSLLGAGAGEFSWELLATFPIQIAGGALIGLAGGYALVWLINRLDLAPGLYPVLALASALFIFGGAQAVGASGFLAVYLVGLIVGNKRHRAAQLIDRFHDGLAWLAQMAMFLMLGLLVTPSNLMPTLLPAMAIAAFLVLVARPVAVLACLLPFRFSWREQAFVAWVGLRGAVAIFLGTIPILAGVENAHVYFEVAFAVVLVSLLVQGWTITPMARALGVELPRLPEPPQRIDVDLPAAGDRDLVVYTVKPSSPVTRQGLRRRLLLEKKAFVSVIRDGKALDARWVDQLEPGDSVLVIAPPERLAVLDRLFAGPAAGGREAEIFGEFVLDGQAPAAEIAALYDFPLPDEAKTTTLGDFVAGRLARNPVAGDRVRVGDVELIVREVEDGRITRIGIELEPITRAWLPVARVRTWLNAWKVPAKRFLARFGARPRSEREA